MSGKTKEGGKQRKKNEERQLKRKFLRFKIRVGLTRWPNNFILENLEKSIESELFVFKSSGSGLNNPTF